MGRAVRLFRPGGSFAPAVRQPAGAALEVMLIFSGEFTYGSHLRWNLGWPSPNYAGAWLACLWPWLWAAPLRPWREWTRPWTTGAWNCAVIATEGAMVFALAHTYSRGALVAAVAALVCFHGGLAGAVPSLRGVTGAKLALRAGALVAAVLVTGFGGRVVRSSAATDASVGNRLEMWRASTEMIAVAPWHGWGAGESGRAYMNWFQRPDREERFATPVNSYLHVAVEHGLPALAVGISFGVFLLLSGLRFGPAAAVAPSGGAWRAAAAASLVAWAVANLFTTLWTEPALWIAPLCSGVLLMGAAWHDWRSAPSPWLRRRVVVAASVGAGACVLLYGVGRSLVRERTIVATPQPDGGVLLSRSGTGPTRHVVARLDADVLGPQPGKELRRWLADCRGAVTLLVPPDGSPDLLRANPEDRLILVGRQAMRVADVPAGIEVWLIHPQGRLPALAAPESPAAIHVVVPEIDQNGDAFRWRRWARKVGVSTTVTSGCGTDIRAQWPMALPPLHG